MILNVIILLLERRNVRIVRNLTRADVLRKYSSIRHNKIHVSMAGLLTILRRDRHVERSIASQTAVAVNCIFTTF